MSDKKIAVLAAGSWGTALAIHLARKGYDPCLWSDSKEVAEEIQYNRLNSKYLPGIFIHERVTVSCDLEKVLDQADTVISALPSHAFREVVSKAYSCFTDNTLFINATKGIDENTRQRISEIYKDISGYGKNNYVVLSGPSHAEEVGMGLPTAVVAASEDNQCAVKAQEIMMSDSFRVYTNPDVVGVELGGSLKNIIALGAGIIDGLGFGDNAKAALITRGLAEIARIGSFMGADPLTFAGLAGVGDVIVTCTSMHSRNRRAGIEIGRGKTPEEAIKSVGMVVEGYRTTKAARKMSVDKGIEMPITEQIYMVLFEGRSPNEALTNLMGRGKRNEHEDIQMYFIKQ